MRRRTTRLQKDPGQRASLATGYQAHAGSGAEAPPAVPTQMPFGASPPSPLHPAWLPISILTDSYKTTHFLQVGVWLLKLHGM